MSLKQDNFKSETEKAMSLKKSFKFKFSNSGVKPSVATQGSLKESDKTTAEPITKGPEEK